MLKRLGMLIILLCTFFIVCPEAQAADFGYSGLSDIQYMWQDPSSGNVRAIDKNGKVAEFNYVSWKIINNGLSAYTIEFRNYDPATKQILFRIRTSGGLSEPNAAYIYNTVTNQWTQLPAALTKCKYLYNGNYYCISSLYVSSYKYILQIGTYSNQGALISCKQICNFNSDDGYFKEGNLNINTGIVNAAFPGSSTNTTHYLINLNNMAIQTFDTYDWCRVFIYPIGCWSQVWNDINPGLYDWSSKQTIGGTIDDYRNGYKIGSSEIGVITTLDSVKKTFVNSSLYLTATNAYYVAACYDKYGNIVFGGTYGRVIVYSPSGVTSTSSNFYTDYLIGGSAQDAYLARLAAEQTKTKVTELSSNVDTNFNNVNTAITNIQNSIAPTIKHISSEKGATATRSSYIDIVVQSSGATQMRTSINGGTWSEWKPLGPVNTVYGLQDGANTIIVEVKNNIEGSATATDQITVFKL